MGNYSAAITEYNKCTHITRVNITLNMLFNYVIPLMLFSRSIVYRDYCVYFWPHKKGTQETAQKCAMVPTSLFSTAVAPVHYSSVTTTFNDERWQCSNACITILFIINFMTSRWSYPTNNRVSRILILKQWMLANPSITMELVNKSRH
jgi:hypothetical protein